MEYNAKIKKKLIEVALPLDAINSESAREKSIRHGHPSTLHLWWARRPLAAARAVIWASLVDDPSSLPEQFPTVEAQNAERERLFDILSRLVKWENSNNQEVLEEAKAEIMKSTGGNPPPLLDPFAGGGAIPLEAQRLGLEAHASDLNPVAVMINKAMIEIPPKFAGQPPVNPDSKDRPTQWIGAQGLAEDVRYYGQWMKEQAFERIGHLYPKVKDEQGIEHTVIAWIWARTVKCPNPVCGCEMPLASSFVLSKKKGRDTYIQPIIDGDKIRYEVRFGTNAPDAPKTGRGQFKCICCNESVKSDYIRNEFANKRSGTQLMAIVAEGVRGRLYFSPTADHISTANCLPPEWKPEAEMNIKCSDLISGRGYGFTHWHELYTNRQLTALVQCCELIKRVQIQIKSDCNNAEYAKAIGVYLAFVVNKATDAWSSFVSWRNSVEASRNTFSRQALPMVWDFTEVNPFSDSNGCFGNMLDWVVKVVNTLPTTSICSAVQNDAQTNIGLHNIMVSTDPPYYDNIGYADLSDFFYIWLRLSLKDIYPDLFRSMLVPKSEELTAMSHRFAGGANEATSFFESGMIEALKQINICSRDDFPTTIYYAYKQSENNSDDQTASTGWETMLSAIIKAGFAITGTWPIRTEKPGRMIEYNTNALASSIVLVCRKRPDNASISSRRDFISALKNELHQALQKLQAANIAPVDMAQSAIGPGMGVYSRYSNVLEADGTPMSVRNALALINQELDLFQAEQDGLLDRASRFCVDLYTQHAYNDIKFGVADVLARAKNTSVEKLAASGAVYAEKGIVRLISRDELPQAVNSNIIWILMQQLTYAMEKDGIVGAAKIVEKIPASEPEQAKSLAYRLFTIAERRGWANEAFAYNVLVTEWPDILNMVDQLKRDLNNAEQQELE